MSKKSRTREEQIILKLYEMAAKLPEDELLSVDALAHNLAINRKTIESPISMLAGINFIVKKDKGFVLLTDKGRAFAEELLEE